MFIILPCSLHSKFISICCSKILEHYKTTYIINTSHNTYFIKFIISHSSQISHTSNTDTHLCWFAVSTLFPSSLHSISLRHRDFHHYANVFQRKTLLFTNFSKSIIKDEIGYALCPFRLQSLKLQPKNLSVFQSEVKRKYSKLFFIQL